MSTLKFKRFTKPHFLKQIGRDTLGQFLNRFSPALAEKQITLPATTLDDDAYYEAVARLAMSLDGLPEALVEAVHAIEGMANEEGEDRLERATGENGRAFEFREDATTAEKAMHAWLTNPEQFAEIFNELRLTRLASYDYYSAKTPMDQTEMFAPPSAQAIELMTADMEAAFRAKNRGQRTCHIEVHWMDGEYWLRIQHGDTYTRVTDITARARNTFKLVGGMPQAFDGDKPRTGKDGFSPLTLAEWVDALVSDAPHLFEANAGGGAAGSGSRGAGSGVVNPFRKESWNLTEQVKLLKNDPGLAARLKASA